MKLSNTQLVMLGAVRRRREELASTTAAVRARIEEQVAAQTLAAQGKMEDILADAHLAGIPTRRLCQAYGTTDYRTVKDLIDRGLARRTEVNTEDRKIAGGILDFISLADSPVHPSAYRVTVTDAPAAVWTYDAQAGDVHEHYPLVWSGYLDVDKATGEVSLISNSNSEVRGPLHLEWTRAHKAGTTRIREVLGND